MVGFSTMPCHTGWGFTPRQTFLLRKYAWEILSASRIFSYLIMRARTLTRVEVTLLLSQCRENCRAMPQPRCCWTSGWSVIWVGGGQTCSTSPSSGFSHSRLGFHYGEVTRMAHLALGGPYFPHRAITCRNRQLFSQCKCRQKNHALRLIVIISASIRISHQGDSNDRKGLWKWMKI